MSLLLESAGLTAPLRSRLNDGLPAFGTCAGMILLAAEVIDGRRDQHSFAAVDIAVRRNGFGRQVDSFETDLEVEGISGGPLHAVFIRAPMVVSAGAGVEVLATVGVGAGGETPVVCRQGPVLVTSFHPELSGDLRLHAMFVASVLASAAGSAAAHAPAARAPAVRGPAEGSCESNGGRGATTQSAGQIQSASQIQSGGQVGR